MKSYDHQQIIKDGKALMSKSLDAYHDYAHAANVEKMALDVYKELKQKNYPDINTVSPELISIVSWWHDCYKAQLSEFIVKSNFNEGKESGRIVRERLRGRMQPEDLAMVIDAVENHAGIQLIPYFFLNRTKSPLHKILLEADGHALLDIGRIKKGHKKIHSIPRTLWILVDLLEVLILPFYLRTKTTRKNLARKIWDFWGAWLWKERYICEVFRNLGRS